MNLNVPIIWKGKATSFYQSQWRNRGTALALPPNLRLVNDDFTPTKEFMGLYLQSWALPLPADEPVCNEDGTPSREHLRRWP